MIFFKEVGSTVSFTQFVLQEFYADNDAVIVKGFFAGKANVTGKAFESDWMMIWKFRGGKIYYYQAFVDTKNVAASLK
jgi:ketosteroid isomerase-like protein